VNTDNLEVVKNDISYIRDDIKEIKLALRSSYVTKDQFAPVKKIAYGTVTFLGLLVVSAIGVIASLAGRK
jgi:thiosulfate reductase cytochrome b subunit